MQRHSGSGYIYLLRGHDGYGDIYKIGRTTRKPTTRIAEMSPKLPFEVEIVSFFWCTDVVLWESTAHRLASDVHVRGEWFRLDERRVEGFKKFAETTRQ